MRQVFAVSLFLALAASPASSAQFLLPSPYPSGVTGAQPLDPEPQGLHGPQRIMLDPYPQALGDYAQGNPEIVRRHRHQRLVKSIYQRKYRVERLGR